MSEPVDWSNSVIIVDTQTGTGPATFQIDCAPPVFPHEGRSQMPQDNVVDATIGKVLDQSFANFHRQIDEAALRRNNAAGFITEQSQYQFMLQQQLVGAKAAGQLDRDALAKSRLDAAAVGTPAAVK